MKIMVLNCLSLALGCANAFAADSSNAANGSSIEHVAGALKERVVSSVEELLAATRDGNIGQIAVSGELNGLPSLRLLPGQTLKASSTQAALHFADDSDGIQLSANNRVENLKIAATSRKRVIFNDTGVADFGRLELQNLTLSGVVQILAAKNVRAGHVEAHNIDIESADMRAYDARPKGYGVEAIPGAFTLWNQQQDSSITITANLTEISAGRPNSPVRGSGILLSGRGDDGGRLLVHQLLTGPVYSDAGIAEGTPNRISGGVFTCYGAFVDFVHTVGPVTTSGPNDMVLDNWGTVDRWSSEDKITSHGPSGIGFVNFGTINSLVIKAPIETFGQGARGFNVYSGTVQTAKFDRIVTHGNGAVGIQIGQPVGRIAVMRGIETFGGTGESLVKGVLTKLSAVAFSVKPEGSVRELKIEGGLITHGAGVPPLELQGRIESLRVKGDALAMGMDNQLKGTKTN